MRRRNFIALLGSAAAAWPLTARAQQGERVRRMGVLVSSAQDDPETKARFAAFRHGLYRVPEIVTRGRLNEAAARTALKLVAARDSHGMLMLIGPFGMHGPMTELQRHGGGCDKLK